MANFQYEMDVAHLPNCPPSRCVPKTVIAYRYVHSDSSHRNNFLPPRLISPQRKLPDSDEVKCSEYALSFYTDKQKAITKYRELCTSFKGFPKLVGTAIAKCNIQPEHGLCSLPNRLTHFDLFQFANVNFISSIASHEEIFNGE
jgi:hypothetical protein